MEGPLVWSESEYFNQERRHDAKDVPTRVGFSQMGGAVVSGARAAAPPVARASGGPRQVAPGAGARRSCGRGREGALATLCSPFLFFFLREGGRRGGGGGGGGGKKTNTSKQQECHLFSFYGHCWFPPNKRLAQGNGRVTLSQSRFAAPIRRTPCGRSNRRCCSSGAP